jgi:hypothetical protein
MIPIRRYPSCFEPGYAWSSNRKWAQLRYDPVDLSLGIPYATTLNFILFLFLSFCAAYQLVLTFVRSFELTRSFSLLEAVYILFIALTAFDHRHLSKNPGDRTAQSNKSSNSSCISSTPSPLHWPLWLP